MKVKQFQITYFLVHATNSVTILRFCIYLFCYTLTKINGPTAVVTSNENSNNLTSFYELKTYFFVTLALIIMKI